MGEARQFKRSKSNKQVLQPLLQDLSADMDIPALDQGEVKKGLFCQFGQSVHREPWSTNDVGTLTQSSQIYSYEADLVLPAELHCKIQGFPNSDWSPWDGDPVGRIRAQRGLAGEAVSYPVYGAALYSFVLNRRGPWWHDAS